MKNLPGAKKGIFLFDRLLGKRMIGNLAREGCLRLLRAAVPSRAGANRPFSWQSVPESGRGCRGRGPGPSMHGEVRSGRTRFRGMP